MVYDRVAGAVELRGEQALGHREADGVGESLAERARGGLDARRDADFGMARRLRVELAEAAQLLERQVVAGEVQQRVLQHRAVPVGEHEAVAIGPGGFAGLWRRNWRQSTSAISAMPIGMPGWPDLAFSTASMARTRMAFAASDEEVDWGVSGIGDFVPGEAFQE
jgi:hypothetical protein